MNPIQQLERPSTLDPLVLEKSQQSLPTEVTALPPYSGTIEGDKAIRSLLGKLVKDITGLLNNDYINVSQNKKLTTISRKNIHDLLTKPFELKTSVEGEEFSFNIEIQIAEIIKHLLNYIKEKYDLEVEDVFIYGSAVKPLKGFQSVKDDLSEIGIVLEELFSKEYLEVLKKEWDDRPKDFDLQILIPKATNKIVGDIKDQIAVFILSKKPQLTFEQKELGLRLMRKKFKLEGIPDKYPYIDEKNTGVVSILVKELAFEKFYNTKPGNTLQYSIAAIGNNGDTNIEIMPTISMDSSLSAHKSLRIPIMGYLETLDYQNEDNPPIFVKTDFDNVLQAWWDNVIKVQRFCKKRKLLENKLNLYSRESLRGFRGSTEDVEKELKTLFIQNARASENKIEYIVSFLVKIIKSYQKKDYLTSLPLTFQYFFFFKDSLSVQEKEALFLRIKPYWKKIVEDHSHLKNTCWDFLSAEKLDVDTAIEMMQTVMGLQLHLEATPLLETGQSHSHHSFHKVPHGTFMAIRGIDKTYWLPVSPLSNHEMATLLKKINSAKAEDQELMKQFILSFFSSFSIRENPLAKTDEDTIVLKELFDHLLDNTSSPLSKLIASFYLATHPYASSLPDAVEALLIALPEILSMIPKPETRDSLLTCIAYHLEEKPWKVDQEQCLLVLFHLKNLLANPKYQKQELIKALIESLSESTNPRLIQCAYSLWLKNREIPQKVTITENLIKNVSFECPEIALDLLISLQQDKSYSVKLIALQLSKICSCFALKPHQFPSVKFTSILNNLIAKKKSLTGLSHQDLADGKPFVWLVKQLILQGEYKLAQEFLTMVTQKSFIANMQEIRKVWYLLCTSLLNDSKMPIKECRQVWKEANNLKVFDQNEDQYWEFEIQLEQKLFDQASGKYVESFRLEKIPASHRQKYEKLYVEYLKDVLEQDNIPFVIQDLEQGQGSVLPMPSQIALYQSIIELNLNKDKPIDSVKTLISLTKQTQKKEAFEVILNPFLENLIQYFISHPNSPFLFSILGLLFKDVALTNKASPSHIASLISRGISTLSLQNDLNPFLEFSLSYAISHDLKTLYEPLAEMLHGHCNGRPSIPESLKEKLSSLQPLLFQKLLEKKRHKIICQLMNDFHTHKILIRNQIFFNQSIFALIDPLSDLENIRLAHQTLVKFGPYSNLSIPQKLELIFPLISALNSHFCYEDSVFWFEKLLEIPESFYPQMMVEMFKCLDHFIESKKIDDVRRIMIILQQVGDSVDAEKWKSLTQLLMKLTQELATSQRHREALRIVFTYYPLEKVEENKHEWIELATDLLVNSGKLLDADEILKQALNLLENFAISNPTFWRLVYQHVEQSHNEELKAKVCQISDQHLKDLYHEQSFSKDYPYLFQIYMKCLIALQSKDLFTFLDKVPIDTFLTLEIFVVDNSPSFQILIEFLLGIIPLISKEKNHNLRNHYMISLWRIRQTLKDQFDEPAHLSDRETVDAALIHQFARCQSMDSFQCACNLLKEHLPIYLHRVFIEEDAFADIEKDNARSLLSQGKETQTLVIQKDNRLIPCSTQLLSAIDITVTKLFEWTEAPLTSIRIHIYYLSNLVRIYNPNRILLSKCLLLSSKAGSNLKEKLLTFQTLLIQSKTGSNKKDQEFPKETFTTVLELFDEVVENTDTHMHLEAARCIKHPNLKTFITEDKIYRFSLLLILRVNFDFLQNPSRALTSKDISESCNILNDFFAYFEKNKSIPYKYLDLAIEMAFSLNTNIILLEKWIASMDTSLMREFNKSRTGVKSVNNYNLPPGLVDSFKLLLKHIIAIIKIPDDFTREILYMSFLNRCTRYIEFLLFIPEMHKEIESFPKYIYKQLMFAISNGVNMLALNKITKTIEIANQRHFFDERVELCQELNLLFWPLAKRSVCESSKTPEPAKYAECVTAIVKTLSQNPTRHMMEHIVKIVAYSQEASLCLSSLELLNTYFCLIDVLSTIDTTGIDWLFSQIIDLLKDLEKISYQYRPNDSVSHADYFFKIRYQLLYAASRNIKLITHDDYLDKTKLEVQESMRVASYQIFKTFLETNVHYESYLNCLYYYFNLVECSLKAANSKDKIESLVNDLIFLVEKMPIPTDEAKIKRAKAIRTFITKISTISNDARWFTIANVLYTKSEEKGFYKGENQELVEEKGIDKKIPQSGEMEF